MLRPSVCHLFIMLCLIVAISAAGQQTHTSVNSGNWDTNTNWSPPGVPDANDEVIINGHTINTNGDRAVNILRVQNNGTLNIDGADDLTFQNSGAGVEVQSGSVIEGNSNNTDWLFGENIDYFITVEGSIQNIRRMSFQHNGFTTTISGGGSISMNDGIRITNDNVTIDNNMTGSITLTVDFDITGGDNNFVLTNDGTITTGDWIFNADNASITNDGTITITNSLTVNGNGDDNNSITNNSGATLNLNAVNLADADFFVYNRGTVDLDGAVTNVIATSEFYNNANGTFLVGTNTIDTDWRFFFSFANNTVNYDLAGNQDILVPEDNYFNISFTGSGTKTAVTSNLDADGTITIANNVTFNPATFDINVGGDWLNNNTAASAGFTEGNVTVTFDGTDTQEITHAAGTETFYNVTVNKAFGALQANDNIQIDNAFTLTSGNVDAGSSVVTVGMGVGSIGSVSRTSGAVIGQLQRWLNATATDYEFPVGTSSNYNGFLLNFANLTSGTLTVQFVDSDPGATGLPLSENSLNITPQFTEGYWQIVAANSLASTDYDLELTAEGFVSNGLNSATRVIKRTNGGSWSLDGTHDDLVASVANRDNLNGISTISTELGLADTDCADFTTSSITGATDVCTSATSEAYSVTDNGNTYTWALSPPAAGTINNNGNAAITIDWSATASEGVVLSVTESSSCQTNDAVTTTININTLATSVISGAASVPENTTGYTYSVDNRSGYTYTWSIPAGNGTIQSGQGTNEVTVDWNAASAATLRVSGQYMTCVAAADEDLAVDVFTAFVSVTSGDWDDGATWGNTSPGTEGVDWPGTTDNARIANSHTVTQTGNETINNLVIDAGGTLSGVSNRLTVNGSYFNDGTHDTGGDRISLDAQTTGLIVSGTGTIDNLTQLRFETNDRTIVSGTDLTITAGEIHIRDDGLTITNQGSISIDGNLEDQSPSGNGVWINDTNSSLEVSNNILQTNGGLDGVLTATATGNTVVYSGLVDQDIKTTTSSQYYNLILSGANDKEVEEVVTVVGDLAINQQAVLDLNRRNFDFILQGDMTVTSTALNPIDAGVQNFSLTGSAQQTISLDTDITLYDLTMNNSTGADVSGANVIVSNNLTMTDGNIDMGSSRITIGTSTADIGSLTRTSGTVIGEMERWMNTEGNPILFPIGTNSNYLPAQVTPTNLTDGTLVATFVSEAPGNSGLPLDEGGYTFYNTFVDGYWDISAENSLASTDYDLELTVAGFTGFTVRDVTRVIKRNTTPDDWGLDGSHGVTVGNTAQRLSLSGFGHFALADTTNCTGPTTSAITGNTTVCASDADEVYSVTNTIGNTYAWTVTGGTIDTGQGTNSITVDWGATGMVGSVEVQETNSCTSGAAVSLSVNIDALPTSSISGRTILAENTQDEAYSVTNTTGYTYTWTITGGTQDQGGTTNSITVDWGSTGTGTVEVSAQAGCGATAATVSLNVTKFKVFTSVQDGDFDTGTTWAGGQPPTATDNVRISDGDSVWIGGNQTINNFIIDVDNGAGGGVFNNDAGNRLTVNGIYENNGTHYLGSDRLDLIATSAGTTIEGVGTIQDGTQVRIESIARTILSTTNLTITLTDAVRVDDDITVTNNGAVIITGELEDRTGGVQWINADSSALSVSGPLFQQNGGGTLSASGAGNTVTYTGDAAQTIKAPASSYHNLSFSGTGTKTMESALDIDNDLTIAGGTVDVSGTNFAINIQGDWTNSGGTFNEQAGTVTFDGTATQGITGAETFYNLVINNTASGDAITMNNIASVTNQLTLTDGLVLTTATNLMSLASAASVTGYSDASFINGPMRYETIGTTSGTPIEFPVGGNSELHRLDLDVDNTPSNYNYTVQWTAGDAAALGYTLPNAPNDKVSENGYWNVGNGGNTVTSATVTLHYVGSDGVTAPSDLRIYKENAAGTAWVDLGGVGSAPTTGTITSTNAITEFSDLSLASSTGLNPLPVELVFFRGSVQDEAVLLEWSTASETNNDHFEVQWSNNGKDFEGIGTLTGQGTTTEASHYRFVHKVPEGGLNYYRLKQVDFDGQSTHHKTIQIDFQLLQEIQQRDPGFVLFPNLTTSRDITLRTSNISDSHPIEIAMVDGNGQLVFEASLEANNGDHPLSMEGTQAGMYFVIVRQNQAMEILRLILQ